MTMKEINEKRGQIRQAMQAVVTAARNENRAVTEEEEAMFADYDNQLADLDRTEKLEKRAAQLAMADSEEAPADEERAAADDHGHSAVNAYIRGQEVRSADSGMSTTENGVMNTEYSSDIIHKVVELSGIMQRISVVNSKGKYKQIVAVDSDKITAGWTDELAEVTASEAKFDTIEIGHYKLGSLYKFSLELLNQNEFDIASEANAQMVQDFALKAETAIIKGTGSKQPTGLVTAGTPYTVAGADTITADEIIEIFHALKAPYHMNAAWIMNNDTLCAVRKLKDGDKYIFHQSEFTSDGFVGSILGKPVLVSEAVDSMGSGNKFMLFGDFARAYKANLNPDISIEVLREKYITQGAVGVIGFMWLDGKPVNSEAYVTVSSGT
ncbi:MAG: phage major capsid protein [Huintestinicola sp.]